MKKLLTLLFFLLFQANTAKATIMCDASCELVVTFPDGGSLVADEAVILTFGTSGELELGATGTINTNPQPVTTNFSTGGLLSLAKGDSITFDENGYIVLGDGGNIDHSALTITSTGSASLKAVGNVETLSLENLSMDGGINLTMTAKVIVITGNLTVGSSSQLNLIADTGSVSPSVCSVEDSSADVVIAGSSITTTNTCASISGTLSLSAGVLSVGLIDPNESIILTSSEITIEESTLSSNTLDTKDSGSSSLSLYSLLLLLAVFLVRSLEKRSSVR